MEVRMSFRHFIITICLMLVTLAPLAAISEGALLFLTIEPGARANAMGRAYSAIADDGYAMWWNPGSPAFNRDMQLAGSYVPWLQGSGMDDMSYQYLGWNQYIEDIGNINAHIVLMDLGTQMHTDTNGEDLGTFHSFDISGAIGYSYDVIPEVLGLGANFKLVYSYLSPKGTGLTESEGKAFSFAFDAGAKYRNVAKINGLDLALVLQNIGPNVTYVDEAQADPHSMTARLGAAYRAIDEPFSKLTFSAEASKILANDDPLYKRFITGWKNFDETIYGAGAEYTYLDLISLRGGYFADTAGKITGPSFGAGIQYVFSEKYKLSMDFAMIPGGEIIDYNKIFSIGLEYKLGK